MDNTAIVKAYADLVLAGRRQLEDVPDTVREDVETLLGVDQNA